jgi:hypothetical protein
MLGASNVRYPWNLTSASVRNLGPSVSVVEFNLGAGAVPSSHLYRVRLTRGLARNEITFRALALG